MNPNQVKLAAKSSPFRPFKVRLSNGALYEFNSSEDIHVTKDDSTLAYFANDGTVVLIDVENIVELTERLKP
jgi:hypothetical protein